MIINQGGPEKFSGLTREDPAPAGRSPGPKPGARRFATLLPDTNLSMQAAFISFNLFF